jgi:hypothetical protein
LLVSHRLGGGVSQHLSELQQHLGRRACFIRLAPAANGTSVALTLSPAGTDALYFDVTSEAEQAGLLRLLAWLGVSRVHFHHVMEVPEAVLALPAALGCGYDLTVHDYYLVNANPSLTDEQGRFAGDEPQPRDAACARHYALPEGCTAEGWRARWLPWLQQAGRLIFPSRDVAARFLAAFNDQTLAARAVVAYHPDSEGVSWPAVRALPEGRPLKVLVLGALGREKGAELLERVAGLLADDVEFHLLGYAFKELKQVVEHGAYVLENLQGKLAAINADVAWFPAQCPETYSYTLSTVFEQGLPVVYPNIGAFAERAEGREHSYMLPWNLPAEQLAGFWRALSAGQPLNNWLATAHAGVQSEHCPPVTAGFYGEHYLAAVPAGETVTEPLAGSFAFAADGLTKWAQTLPAVPLSHRERLLLLLWRVRHLPGVRGFVRLVPYSLQQKLKQRLSKKQLHEILPKHKP